MATVMKRAKELAVEDTVSETASRGWLPPSKLVSPLGGGGYSESEYSMLERDRGKWKRMNDKGQQKENKLNIKAGQALKWAIGCVFF